MNSEDAIARQDALAGFAYTLVGEQLDDSLVHSHPVLTYTVLRSMTEGNLFAKPEDVTPVIASLEFDIRLVVWLQMNKIFLEAPLLDNGRRSITLFDTLKTELQWVREGNHNIFSWLSQIQHVASSFAYKATKPARFLWASNGLSFKYRGEQILWSSWLDLINDAMSDVLDEFNKIWEVLGLDAGLQIRMQDFEKLEDALDNQSTNYTFLKAQGNQWIDDLQLSAWSQMADSGKFCKVVNGKLVWFPGAMQDVLRSHKKYLINLSYAMYLLGGQPPRGTELMHTQWRNTPGRIRNLFMYYSYLINLGFLNKTTFLLKMDKPIPRGYPPSLGFITVNYLAFIRMFELHFALELDQVKSEQSIHKIHKCNSRLFIINGEELVTEHLTNHMKKKTHQHLKVRDGLGTSDMRHIIIFIGEKKVTSPSSSEAETSVMHLQAGHNSTIARQHYGTEMDKLANDIGQAVIDEFLGCSKSHWTAYGILHLEEVGQRIVY